MSRLTQLSQQIATNTAIVDEYTQREGIKLGFGVNDTAAFPSDAPAEVLEARRIVREATQELNDLVTGPAEQLRWLACRYHDLSSLRWIYHFNLYSHIPLDKAITFEELAQKAGVDATQAKRILRHAMTNNLFHEPHPGQIAHTASSALLIHSRGVRDWVGYTTEESFRNSSKLVEATEKWGASDRLDQSAYQVAWETELPMFEHLGKDAVRAERFANTMTDMTSTDGYNIRHLVSGFEWSSLAEGSTVVDVGGSVGHACIAIAEKARGLQFIVQDRPEIVPQGEKQLEEVADEQIRSRIKFQAHDFFTPQPVEGAAVYLMRFILHDHPDSGAIDILRKLVPALKNGSRIVIMDGVMPEANVLPKSEERIMRIMDLEMMTTFNAKERERADWEKLYSVADSRLKLKNVERPVGSAQSVMEVVFEDEGNAS
ncbi:hypothetical protein PRZ48_014043 [Zasmidium cellare]|uniref:O-methyltransferase C-terminal domain-containing protein n=1 Tax=Zasmidium cellare TaxID=395010 RepID=A0ABR0DZW8_ZASCE|nr:hypothetical protein PRZ48_014043 [Zasmidium cellare]